MNLKLPAYHNFTDGLIRLVKLRVIGQFLFPGEYSKSAPHVFNYLYEKVKIQKL